MEVLFALAVVLRMIWPDSSRCKITEHVFNVAGGRLGPSLLIEIYRVCADGRGSRRFGATCGRIVCWRRISGRKDQIGTCDNGVTDRVSCDESSAECLLAFHDIGMKLLQCPVAPESSALFVTAT